MLKEVKEEINATTDCIHGSKGSEFWDGTRTHCSTDSVWSLSKIKLLFCRSGQSDHEIQTQMQGTPNSQNNLGNEEQIWMNKNLWLQNTVQSYSNQKMCYLELDTTL